MCVGVKGGGGAETVLHQLDNWKWKKTSEISITHQMSITRQKAQVCDIKLTVGNGKSAEGMSMGAQ